ncbi:MAG: phosphate starvation-inducible protein [Burkholderiales bacterium]|nr:phosphate starvation-inducible protein [Burkholderiales bacterium]
MIKSALFLALSIFAAPYAYAQTPQQTKMKECNEQADGMKGDERKAFMKTCLSAKSDVKADGKTTDQQGKMTACNADAKKKNLTGDEHKAFMKECLSAKAEAASDDKMTGQQSKMKTCNADAAKKKLAGEERKTFMKACLSNYN